VFVARTPFDRPCLAAFCACAYVSDEAHVHNLATQPDRRRQGLARLLLTVAASVGRRKGATVAHLEVRAGNAPARALYVRMGYREVGTRRDYYASPREDAVLLSLALQAGPSPAAVAPPQHRC
jgi:ribosomal protein S18 acetylase RimI-like enzyme